MKIGRPTLTEAAPYFHTYIDKVPGDDPLLVLRQQYEGEVDTLLHVSESESLCRSSPGKWSMREIVSHLADSERIFSFRALWFARGFIDPLPSFDQVVAVNNAEPDQVASADHIEEFRRVRLATMSLFQNLPVSAWSRSGIASGQIFSVRALAFVIAGHFTHHRRALQKNNLNPGSSAPDGIA